jgi:hypothetical protein
MLMLIDSLCIFIIFLFFIYSEFNRFIGCYLFYHPIYYLFVMVILYLHFSLCTSIFVIAHLHPFFNFICQ